MEQSLIDMTSHLAAALAAKTWLMYGKGKKQCQYLKLVCGSTVCRVWHRHTIYSNLANNAKNTKL